MNEPNLKPNRLIHETSPYLLQHAYNPVDWWPWSDEAFERARAEEKPVLLSCGYSACHWCHVMERESFENEEIAVLMNRYFINIKVDREERPDLDQLYQQAVQMIAGQGGWPLTVFLDYERKPFFGGTYFPPVPGYGRPSFPQVLEAIHQKWQTELEKINEAGGELLKLLTSVSRQRPGDAALPDQDLPLKVINQLNQLADHRYGGFGSAPKFPNPGLIQLFLRAGTAHDNSEAREQALFTLRQMARGGIYDQLGGGFHRYSTDQRWLVPHFEKMLYDNAQLLKLYTIGYQISHSDELKKVVRETADYVRREMTAPEGGFYATQDADSAGEEGRFFLWTVEEIQALLSPDEAELVIGYYGVTPQGNFEGKNILNRLEQSGNLTDQEPAPEFMKKLAQAKDKLFQYREQREKPFRDEKIITSWNGLMIGAMAYAHQVLQREEDYLSAKRAAEFCLEKLRAADGSLFRTYRDGQGKIEAFLDDYAFLAQGLIDLYETDFNENWLAESLALTKTAIQRFSDGAGCYYLTTKTGEDLISRPASGHDQAIPGGVSVQVENLLRLASFTGEKELLNEAEKILTEYGEEMEQDFWSFAGMIQGLDLYHQGFKEFTFLSKESEIPEILIQLRKSFIPYRILVWGNNFPAGLASHPARELFKDREVLNGKPTCYVCLAYRCLPPVTEWGDLQATLVGNGDGIQETEYRKQHDA
jgi:uncharacterized protein